MRLITFSTLLFLACFSASAALVTPTSVTTSSQFGTLAGGNTINGSGLSGVSPNQTHDNNANNMWLSDLNDVVDAFIAWDLGSIVALSNARIWNYNQFHPTTTCCENRGIQQVDIYVSTLAAPGDPEGGGVADWALFAGNAMFAQANETATYAGFTFDFAGVLARHVRFEIDSNFGSDQFGNVVGLSEIQYYSVPAVPIPAALPLFLSGMVVLGFVGRKKRQAEAQA